MQFKNFYVLQVCMLWTAVFDACHKQHSSAVIEPSLSSYQSNLHAMRNDFITALEQEERQNKELQEKAKELYITELVIAYKRLSGNSQTVTLSDLVSISKKIHSVMPGKRQMYVRNPEDTAILDKLSVIHHFQEDTSYCCCCCTLQEPTELVQPRVLVISESLKDLLKNRLQELLEISYSSEESVHQHATVPTAIVVHIER